MDKGTKIAIALKRHHAQRRQGEVEALLSLNGHAPRLAQHAPFQGSVPTPKLQHHYIAYAECGLSDGTWRFFIYNAFDRCVDSADDYLSARAKLIERSLPNVLLAHIPTPF